MSEPITSSFLKEIKNPITLLIIGILAIFIAVGFISFQVYNHIPTQMDRIEKRMDSQYNELKQDIKEVKEELKQDINRLEDKMDNQYKELNNKMDKLNERMDKVLYYLIDNKGKK